MLTAAEWAILGLSLQVALAAVALLLIPGIALGWLLARRQFAGKSIVDALVHLPLVLPPVVTGWLLLMLLGRHSVLGGFFADTLGWRFVFDWKGAVVAGAVMALPLLVRAVRLAIELQDRAVEDAAAACGAPPWRVFTTVTLPLAAPGIVAGTMLAFARCLGEFGATITLAGSIPGETRTLPAAIYGLIQSPDGEAAVWRLVGISLVVAVAALAGSEWLARRWTVGR